MQDFTFRIELPFPKHRGLATTSEARPATRRIRGFIVHKQLDVPGAFVIRDLGVAYLFRSSKRGEDQPNVLPRRTVGP